MIQIIPIELNKEDYTYIEDAIIEKKSSFVTSIKVISKLINRIKYPIKNKWIAIWNILSFLNMLDNKCKINNNTIIPIETTKFIEFFNINRYKEYRELLQELEIITKVPYNDGSFYTFVKDGNNNKCMQYRIHNDYLNDDICMILFEDKNELILNKDNDYNSKMEKTILKTKIDYKNAFIEEIKKYKEQALFNKQESINKLKHRLSAILQLSTKRYINKGHKVNRIYNSFSNLSRISRKHLSLKGQKFKSIDIKNCQPLLLSYFILQSGDLIDDIYLEVCQNGTFYETLMDTELVEKMNEDEYEEYRILIKEEVYKNILFNLNKTTDITIKFAELYPNVYYFLDNYYKHNLEETMASNLQNLEASIFNNIEVPKSIGYFTLFDAIYFTDDSDIDFIYNKINTEFNKLNITPSLKLNLI
jgi:hypothetical protein